MSMCLRRRFVAGVFIHHRPAVAVPVEEHRGLRAVRNSELSVDAAEVELVAQTNDAVGARRGIPSFPPAIPQNPYQRLLYAHLDDLGVPLETAERFDVGWLRRARREVAALHFHWPQGYYRHAGRGAVL